MKMKVDHLGLPTEKEDVVAALQSTISLIPHTSHRGKALHLLTKLSDMGGAGVPVHEAGDPSLMPVHVFQYQSSKPNTPADIPTYKGFHCQNDSEVAAELVPRQSVVAANQVARDTYREGDQLFEMTLTVVGTALYLTTVPLAHDVYNQSNQTKTTLIDNAVPEGAIPFVQGSDDVTLNNARGEAYGYVTYNSTTKKITAKVWEIQTEYSDVVNYTGNYSYTFAEQSLDLETLEFAIGDIKVALAGLRQIIISVDIHQDGNKGTRTTESIRKVIVFTCARYFGGGESPAVFTYDITGGAQRTYLLASTTNLWAGLIVCQDDGTNAVLYELTPKGASDYAFAQGDTVNLQMTGTYMSRFYLLTRKGSIDASNHVLVMVDPQRWYTNDKLDNAVGTWELTINDMANVVVVQRDLYNRVDLDPDLEYLAPTPESHWNINQGLPAFLRLFSHDGKGSTKTLNLDGVNPKMQASSISVLPLSAPMCEALQKSPFNYVETRYSNNQNVYHVVVDPRLDPETRKRRDLAVQYPMTGGSGWSWYANFTKNDIADPTTITTELTGYLATVDMGGHPLEAVAHTGSSTQFPVIYGTGVFFIDHLGCGLDDDAPVGTQVLLVRRKNSFGHDRTYRSRYPELSGAFVIALSAANPDNVRVLDCIRNVNTHSSYRGALYCEKTDAGWVTQNLI